MDEFVKSVVAHIVGGERDEEQPIQAQQQTLYRPNYQRNRKGGGCVRNDAFYCVDIEPENQMRFEKIQKNNMLEEDLRWIRLNAKEG